MKVTIEEPANGRPVPEVVRRFGQFIERFTYKPGVQALLSTYWLDLDRTPLTGSAQVQLSLIAEVLDSRDWQAQATVQEFLSGGTITMNPLQRRVTVMVPRSISLDFLERSQDNSPDEVMGHLVREVIRQHEHHEMDEWLRFDGKHVVDPHPVPAS